MRSRAGIVAGMVSGVLGALSLGVLDLLRAQTPGAGLAWTEIASTFALGGGLAVAASVIVMLPLVTILALIHTRRRGESEEDPLAWFLEYVVKDGGFSRRAMAVSAGVVAVAGILSFSMRIVTHLELGFGDVLILAAVWQTASVVLPVLACRLLVWRRGDDWRPNAVLVWGLLTAGAYGVTSISWVGVSPYTIAGAVPILAIGATATMHSVLRHVRRGRWLVNLLAAGVFVLSVVQLAAYPVRSVQHAAIHSGPVFVRGAWYVLAGVMDIDGDGASQRLGGTDCDGFNYERRPTGLELVGNGVDENCSGSDLNAYTPAPARKQLQGMTAMPTVVVITVDALRADAVGRVLKGRPVTPVIDELLAESVQFTRAYSVAASTDEAVPAMWTGMYPSDWHQHGVYFGVEPTLAQLLGESGYETIAVLLHPWLSPSLYYGFETVDNSLGDSFRDQTVQLTGSSTTRIALERVDARDPDKPLLLWVHYFDPHLPRFPISGLHESLDGDPYLQSVHTVDIAIGQLLAGLRDRRLLDDSLIVFASDHGEGLGDHGVETHGWAIWESIIRIPLAIRFPGSAGAQINVPVSLVNVAPTLIDHLGLDDGVRRDGRSLLPLVRGASFAAQPIFVETPVDRRPTHFAVIDRELKFSIDLRSESYRLFDVVADPGEQHNLIEKRTEDAARLEEMLGQWRDEMYNDRRLERKRDLWESRSSWEPELLVTGEETIEAVKTFDD